jgi:hypothetical protein
MLNLEYLDSELPESLWAIEGLYFFVEKVLTHWIISLCAMDFLWNA